MNVQPIPIFQGDAQGSVYAVMLFPDDLELAHAWHARFLARRPLPDYLAAGHNFSKNMPDFLRGVANSARLCDQEAARWEAGALVGNTVKTLWALICDEDRRAGWARSITMVSQAMGQQHKKGSPSHIRSQLRRYSTVLHLWGAWSMCNKVLPSNELVAMSGALLGQLKAWNDARPLSFRHEDSYLLVDPFGPWPGWEPTESRLPRLSGKQGLQSEL